MVLPTSGVACAKAVYSWLSEDILNNNTTKLQFNIKILLLLSFEVAVFAASYKFMPEVHGFSLQFSRMFLLGCLLGALVSSFVIAVMKYKIATWQFTQSLIISTAVSGCLGYSALLLHACQMSEAPQWPGMAGIYMLPGAFIISAVASIFISHFLPIRLLNALVCKKSGKF